MCEFLRTIHLVLLIYFYSANSAPQQQPEINDQFQLLNHTEVDKSAEKNLQHVETNTVLEDDASEVQINNKTEILDIALAPQKPSSFVTRMYLSIKEPVVNFISIPRVNTVLKNVGTCIVNGAMEIVTFYFPAPMIPLIASAAGMIMPFEPVVTLRRRMPVASYRRAVNAAVNSFMGTFDQFKEPIEDPYMTRRFNRRFLNEDNPMEFVDKDKVDN